MNTKHAIKPSFKFTSVRELIEWAAEYHGDKTAFSYRLSSRDKEVQKVSFVQMANDIRALASRLLELGCAGKHCALIGKLSYEWVLTYYAVLSIGGVLVPLDRDWLKEDLADTGKKSDAEYLFGDEDIAEKIEYIAEYTSLSAEPVYLLSHEKTNTLSNLTEEGRILFEEAPALYYSVSVNPLNMALLVFTSGTTGKGKGVMLNQNAILSDMYNAVHYLDYGDKTIDRLVYINDTLYTISKDYFLFTKLNTRLTTNTFLFIIKSRI